ncbi:hypothetical protein B0A48_08974 [Cryoendolithus antarcticus]|uniref:Uncharacterized protein n=1 Tax=Cryoendolithus antarcticus TaxID=1507870 RepID=A0A1V8T515_9PEZI|nr:hypothetical protein B0A48_08974 [Cryoendolithus antarcticus]
MPEEAGTINFSSLDAAGQASVHVGSEYRQRYGVDDNSWYGRVNTIYHIHSTWAGHILALDLYSHEHLVLDHYYNASAPSTPAPFDPLTTPPSSAPRARPAPLPQSELESPISTTAPRSRSSMGGSNDIAASQAGERTRTSVSGLSESLASILLDGDPDVDAVAARSRPRYERAPQAAENTIYDRATAPNTSTSLLASFNKDPSGKRSSVTSQVPPFPSDV